MRNFAIVFLLVLSCGKEAEQHEKAQIYKSFREIPGITASEIEAVEALRAKKASFVYGMLLYNESSKSQNPEIRGYSTALLCEYFTELFGFDIIVATYDWDDLISGLANGSIDFTGELTANDERRKDYYMTDAISERTVKTFRLKDAEPISQIIAARLPRYGFLNGAITASTVSLFSDHEFEAVFVPNHDVVHGALISGQIDAFLEESSVEVEVIFDEYDDMVSTAFSPIIYSSMSLSTRNPELAPIISIVQKMLRNGSNKYLIDLYNLGRKKYAKAKLERSFSEEEREYIRQNPVVLFAAEFDNYPMSFYNVHEKQWQGITFDVLGKVEELTGLTFKVANAPDASFPELFEKLEKGEVSMVSELIRSKDREGRFLWPEIVLMQDAHAIVSKIEYPDIEANEILYARVGLTRGTAHEWLFNNWFQNHANAVVFENTDDALEALELGSIDLVMTSQNRVFVLTNYLEKPGYKVNFLFDRSYGSSFGFNKNEHILRSIIDKSLEQSEVNKISDRWRHKAYNYQAKLAKSQLIWITGSFVLLIIFMFVLYRSKHSEGKRLEALVKKRTAELDEQRKLLEFMSLTDPLTGLPNRRCFDLELDTEWRIAMREKRAISILMMDIDHFKNYNDQHGHQSGDEVLCAIAKIIDKTLKRPSDFVARWGGEEFVVLLTVGTHGALNVAEAIRSNVEKANISLSNGIVAKVTISIGVNTQVPDKGYLADAFVSAADKELYEAKKTGRNKVCCNAVVPVS